MNINLKNKIEARHTTIKTLLKDQKFYIDYFQRDYRWQEKHIKTLIEDLTFTFFNSYNTNDKPSDVVNYQSYYLGTVVLSMNTETSKNSIIDGQQRMTSITLFLIYLNHLQRKFDEENKVPISDLIFSVSRREKSFNMTDENRTECLKALFERGEYICKETDDETVINMVERYTDIVNSFPDELTDEKILLFFIDWFIENVIIVEITTYSDENAYTIFETMNDRGLNLTPTEMLKGFVLSKIKDIKKRNEINELWKENIQNLHEYGENVDQSFFQSWFRGKYARDIRQGQANAENKDFEHIGTRFHSWFKDNHKEIFNLNTSDEFYSFFKMNFSFYVKLYISMWKNQTEYNKLIPHLYYVNYWGIAESLQDPLLISSIDYGDTDDIINKKLDFVARYIETFTTIRAVNYKKFGQTSIKYTMFNLIKLIRDNNLETLGTNLSNEIENMEQGWENVINFGLHSQNKKFIKHLLCRISSYTDNLIGKSNTYESYNTPDGKQYEIEHIWSNVFDNYKDEFEQENDFKNWRNSIGALVLLPNGTNQSFNKVKYEEKIEHYIKENTYVQTLHSNFYVKNPNFLKSEIIKNLNFKPHNQFKKIDIEERARLVMRICKELWSKEYYEI